MILDEINIWIGSLWVGLTQSIDIPEQNKEAEYEGTSAWLHWAGTLVVFYFQTRIETTALLASQACWFGLELRLSVTLALRPLDSDWNYMIYSPGSPACRQKILSLLSLHNEVSQLLKISLFLQTHPPPPFDSISLVINTSLMYQLLLLKNHPETLVLIAKNSYALFCSGFCGLAHQFF